ncbi:hypothetical protein [Mesobacillus foraminis]|uniref:hypothetical protein n=1 Tax=Mesobacillus foraminis TaxID=279826 RepID=UPI000EF53999|nr:hypothetical protein [Mesobacillus foraminis]
MNRKRKFAWPVMVFFLFTAGYMLMGQMNNVTQPFQKEFKMVDVYNMYYVTEIQEILGEEGWKEEVEENLKDKTLEDIKKGDLTTLPAIWFFEKLKKGEPSELHQQEVSSYILNLQQDDGMFLLDPAEAGEGESTFTGNLLPTKLSIEVLKKYGEPIPKKEKLIQTLTKELHHRLEYGSDLILNDHDVLIIQILTQLDRDSEILQKARETIPFEMIEKNIRESARNFEILPDLVALAELLHPSSHPEKVTLEIIEASLKELQLDNGLFPFPGTKDPDILSTYHALSLMEKWELPISNQKRILEFTNEIGKNSF